MDNKKKKKASSHFDVWPPVRRDDDKKEDREEKMKPRNPSFVDRFEELQSEINAPVFEAEEEYIEKPETEKGEEKDKSHNDSDKYSKDK